jgi:phosphoglycerate dehydrogenase-like enzyme
MRIGSYLPRTGLWGKRLDELAASLPGHVFVLDPAQAASELASLDAIIANRLPDEIWSVATRLKAVFVPFAGVNHLPVSLLAERGVRIFNSHGNAAQVAERALAMTLAFYGRVIEFHEDLRAEKWHGFWVGHGAEDQWPSLRGRRVAIFGAGAIGSALATLLSVFDCEICAYRRHPDSPLPPGFHRVETDFRKAVAEAELLFVALPLTPETKGLFSRDLLLGAKGKFLVNVGRGEVVDEEGLYLSLRDGILAGAAIDTWYTYPEAGSDHGAPSRFPIHLLPNVVLSPHVAGSAREAAEGNVSQTLDNLRSWLVAEKVEREVRPGDFY